MGLPGQRTAAQQRRYLEVSAAKQRRFNARHPGIRPCAKAWREKNPGKVREMYLRHHYRLSAEEYEAMRTAQAGLCAICGDKPQAGRRLSVDHDHMSGKVRELLCTRCNLFLGRIEGRPWYAEAVLAYLDKHMPDEAVA